MKKLALLFLAGISFATTNAQFQFGVKAGADFSTWKGKDVSAKTITGFNGGVYAKLPVTQTISVQPELVYSGQGAKLDADPSPITSRANYFNIPVLLKYQHFTGLFIETGPQLGFLMSSKEKEGGDSYDNKSAFKSSDFAWVFGVGYKIPATQLAIDLRYNLGISNIGVSGPNRDPNSVYNRVFQIGLMYTLVSLEKK
jgi:hypothetical protein